MAADGSSPRLIAAGATHEWAGEFSPDGKWLVFPSDREPDGLYIVAVAGGEPRALDMNRTRGGESLRVGTGGSLWSRDGRWIVYSFGRDLWMVSPRGDAHRLVARGEDFGGVVTEVGGFSLDGRTVYVRVHAPDGSAHIGAVELDGSNPRIVVRFDDPGRRAYRPEFSTDGRNFYFTIGKHEADIWVMELQKK
jgi:Tol biopolymer transport system component